MRKVLLRLMLGSLGFAAAAGVLAALSGGDQTVWRVVGTGFATALACGLMLPFTPMLDQEKTRTVGLSGVAVILVEFLLAMALIWEAPELLFGLQWEVELAQTMLFFGLAAVALAPARKLAAEPQGRLAGRVGVGTIVVTFGAFLIAIWGPERFINDEKWWESGSAVFTIGLLVLLSLVGAGAGAAPRLPWRRLAIPAGVIAFAMWMSNVWLGTQSAFGSVVFSVLVSVAAVVGHANLCLLVRLPSNLGWLRGGVIAAGMLTAALIDLVIVKENYSAITWDAELLSRFSAAAAITAGCGTIALLVLARIYRGVDREIPVTELSEMRVTCPRCRKKQSIEIGESSCSACDLRISIRVEESVISR
jgi:MFS family permease